MRKNISIIDYGIGNYASLHGIFNRLNCLSRVTNEKNEIKKSDLIILPGVGTYKPAIKKLRTDKLDKLLKSMALDGKFILGICLGMQILSSSSIEDGFEKGLDIIPGKIDRIKGHDHNIGWSGLKLIKKDDYFKNLKTNNQYYFQHGYSYDGHKRYKFAETEISPKITGIIKFKNTVGVQFHPEKSQKSGEQFFLNILGKIK
jgi:glutamine amidotransferase